MMGGFVIYSSKVTEHTYPHPYVPPQAPKSLVHATCMHVCCGKQAPSCVEFGTEWEVSGEIREKEDMN